MNYIRFSGGQKLRHLTVAMGDLESFRQLPSHEQLAVTKRDDLGARDAANGRNMLVGNFAATNDSDT